MQGISLNFQGVLEDSIDEEENVILWNQGDLPRGYIKSIEVKSIQMKQNKTKKMCLLMDI